MWAISIRRPALEVYGQVSVSQFMVLILHIKTNPGDATITSSLMEWGFIYPIHIDLDEGSVVA